MENPRFHGAEVQLCDDRDLLVARSHVLWDDRRQRLPVLVWNQGCDITRGAPALPVHDDGWLPFVPVDADLLRRTDHMVRREGVRPQSTLLKAYQLHAGRRRKSSPLELFSFLYFHQNCSDFVHC